MHPTTNIAIRAARAAGKLLLQYSDRIDRLKIETKRNKDFVTEIDRAAEHAVIEVIRTAFPDHAILAEESGLHTGDEHQWIIDPLDGTTNYLHGFPHYAVSIALRYKSKLLNAVVFDPSRDELFHAARGEGAFLNDRRIRTSHRKGLTNALLSTGIPFHDLTHADAYFAMLRDLIVDSAGIRRPGAAALDFAWLAAGRTDGFWELGLSPWDCAAGALLIKEAGGQVSDLAGGESYLETGNVVAAGAHLHPSLLAAIQPHLNKQLKA